MRGSPKNQQSVTITGMQGANQAAAAASLGYPTYFLGQVIWLANYLCFAEHTQIAFKLLHAKTSICLLICCLAGRHRC